MSKQISRQIDMEDVDHLILGKYTDVIGEKLGGSVVSFSDQWFAEAKNLIKPTPPVSHKGEFGYAGAVYDGWETRRHNTEPSDWVTFKLGVPLASIFGCEVDTAFFNGNQAPAIYVEATHVEEDGDIDEAKWDVVIGEHSCGPDTRQFFIRDEPTTRHYNYARLNMVPDGGIARFRLYGKAIPEFPSDPDAIIDLAHVYHGGVAVACSDQHFGTIDNLVLPGRGINMGDGWETKRSRGKDHVDWAIIKLGARARIQEVVVDTAHFRGNYPQSVIVKGADLPPDVQAPPPETEWFDIVGKSKTGPDKEHAFPKDSLLSDDKSVTHVKLIIIPDGGVKRVRVFGQVVPSF